jgi:hypothetical protein
MRVNQTKFYCSDVGRLCICFVPLLFSTNVCLARSTVPMELFGKWCSESEIEFNATGYKGAADSEQYGCDITRIQKIAEDTWKGEFVCEGEFGRSEVISIIRRQRLKGIELLGMANSLKHRKDAARIGVSALSIQHRC